MTIVPPIKIQGIKTRLSGWIQESSADIKFNRWVEPFMGTGVVAFNVNPKAALLCDNNPHLIAFYKAIQDGTITSQKTRTFLTKEGALLLKTDGEHYYKIRERFNAHACPLDFLFLSRSCFNGLMRFNKSGGFNVPSCRKPNRFAKALITKICNQIDAVAYIIGSGDYEFKHQDFRITFNEIQENDLIYCDPPYIGRSVDYFNSWSEEDEQELNYLLKQSGMPFIISTWYKNLYRTNDNVLSYWGDFSILLKEHFYHIGAKESNRNSIFEALIMNHPTSKAKNISQLDAEDLKSFMQKPQEKEVYPALFY